MAKKAAKKPEKPGPKIGPEGRSVVLAVSVPSVLLARLDKRRRASDLTRSAAVTAALREWLG